MLNGIIIKKVIEVLQFGMLICCTCRPGRFLNPNKIALTTTYSALYRASDISRGRGPAKFRYFREIPRNCPKNAKYREIRQKYFQIHVGKTYLILILAIRPVLFTPNVHI